MRKVPRAVGYACWVWCVCLLEVQGSIPTEPIFFTNYFFFDFPFLLSPFLTNTHEHKLTSLSKTDSIITKTELICFSGFEMDLRFKDIYVSKICFLIFT